MAAPQPKRLLSLDVFRGVVIAAMILVNSPGNDIIYTQLQHSPWNGWTAADLVFPSFLMIMGVSLAISMSRRLAKSGRTRSQVWTHMAWRSTVILGFGLIGSLALYHPPSGVRIMGVLQRISVCYLACALAYLATGPSTQGAVAASLLTGYWLLMTRVPVPGFGPGVLTPEGNLASYLDRRLLGSHMFTPLYDPEGLLSTIPAIASALLGLLAGEWLRSRHRNERKPEGLLLIGLSCAAAGCVWSIWFPINKNLWTSSYVLFAGGLSLVGLAACYWIIEIRDLKAWGKPFEVFGRNALLAYFLSGLIYGVQEFIPIPYFANAMTDGSQSNLKLWLCGQLFGWWLAPINASLAYALAYTMLCLGLMWFLYRKQIFLKV